jgi:hypothetical protein
VIVVDVGIGMAQDSLMQTASDILQMIVQRKVKYSFITDPQRRIARSDVPREQR